MSTVKIKGGGLDAPVPTGFKDYNPMEVDPNKKQFEPTEATPIRQHAQMAGDPFQSQAQRGFMYARHPEIAKRWEKETPKGKKLPYHKKKSKR